MTNLSPALAMWLFLAPAQAGAPASSPAVHPVKIKAEDGAVLEGDEWLPREGERPAAGILLLPADGTSRKSWGDFPGTLARSGYRVLALDFRGHGGLGLTRTSVALSPDRDRTHLLSGHRQLHMQSLLLLAMSGDPGRESQARRLFLEARLPKDVHVLTGTAEDGEAILAARPEAIGMILDWLHRTL